MPAARAAEWPAVPGPPVPAGGVRARRLGPAWPLTVLLAGFPLWWLLGLSQLLPLALVVPMVLDLARRRPVRLPAGTGWLLLFLVCAAAGVLMLGVDAPGAVPGAAGTRVLVYAYQSSWYVACVVAFVWLSNTTQDEVPTRRVVRLLAWMFVVTVAGGLLGVLAPRFEITSPVEALLPGSLASNAFVESIVHPQAANLTTFLGREEYRPVAPFAYANSWGANFSIFLPFFVHAWLGRTAGWRRRLAPVVLVAAAVPVVYSMNRGLWAALALSLAFVVVRAAFHGHRRLLVGVVATTVLGFVVFASSPLAERLEERLDNAHSNDRRSQLLTQTVTSTAEGSPVVGFGATRDVQGSFASIAGGATPDCPACGVPPLGTQGHLWFLVFTKGFLGTVCFLAFLLARARRHWRVRTGLETAAMVALACFLLELFVYDTLGMPMYALFLGLALLGRSAPDASQDATTLEELLGDLRRRTLPLALTTVLGGVAGAGVATTAVPQHSAQVSVLLAETPVHLDGRTATARRAETTTVDTEAALVLSSSTMARLEEAIGELPPGIRDDVGVSAPPNTRLLTIEYRDVDRARAVLVAEELAQAYLLAREEHLAQRRQQVLHSLHEQLAEIQGLRSTRTAGGSGLDETQLRQAIDNLTIASTSAGEPVANQVRRLSTQPEVPVTSGALLGLVAGLALITAHRPSRAPRPVGVRQKETT